MLSHTCFCDAIGVVSSGFLTRCQRNHATIGVYVSCYQFDWTSLKHVRPRSRCRNYGGFDCDGPFYMCIKKQKNKT